MCSWWRHWELEMCHTLQSEYFLKNHPAQLVVWWHFSWLVDVSSPIPTRTLQSGHQIHSHSRPSHDRSPRSHPVSSGRQSSHHHQSPCHSTPAWSLHVSKTVMATKIIAYIKRLKIIRFHSVYSICVVSIIQSSFTISRVIVSRLIQHICMLSCGKDYAWSTSHMHSMSYCNDMLKAGLCYD